ncbi:MAG: hypothetical protein WA208_11285 [Thermoanaerobaculia bacterium]
MKTRLIAVTALTLLLAMAVVAQTAPQAPRPPMAPRAGQLLGPAMIAEFLDLSAAQIEQVKALQAKLGETLKPFHEEQRANGEALKAAVDAGDALKAGQALIAGKAIREKIKAAIDAHKAAFATLLTAPQKAKWDVYQEIQALRAKRPQAPVAPPLPPRP